MKKRIVLIGGTAGTGKTTLAREISCFLGIDHRLGTGFVREIIKAQTSREVDGGLFEYTFKADYPVQHLIGQANRIYSAIEACINRARNEGTSLIIEGNHLIPTLYSLLEVDHYIVLGSPDEQTHFRMLQGNTHSERLVSVSDLRKVREIDEYLRKECRRLAVPYLPHPVNVEDLLQRLR
ncbi:AAA family ATPase [Candidatus Woesearchaeota archaeon]|nr:AAA family ATPase [Candidatus Woesearchaeota archaeon]